MDTAQCPSDFHLEQILSKASDGVTLTREEIRFLLNLNFDRDLSRLFQVARELRYHHFGNSVFLYGFVYFSTWCRNNCIFCFYRKSNLLARRYRKSEKEVTDIASKLAQSGVHLIDLTMGEDPFFLSNARAHALWDLAKEVKGQTGLPLMISSGVIPEKALRALRGAGVDWYACYQETHNRSLFRRLRPDQDYDTRLDVKKKARQIGFLIEDGILVGTGNSIEDVVDSIEAMKSIGAHQMRVMTLIPQKGTPLENTSVPSFHMELVTIAILRLLFPNRLIPASLDVMGIQGLRDRLFAGANVITSLIHPHEGLAGVSQSVLDIDEGYRTVERVTPVLEQLGLERATESQFTKWMQNEAGS